MFVVRRRKSKKEKSSSFQVVARIPYPIPCLAAWRPGPEIGAQIQPSWLVSERGLAAGRGELGSGARFGDRAGVTAERGDEELEDPGGVLGLEALGAAAFLVGEYATGLSCIVESVRSFVGGGGEIGVLGMAGRVLLEARMVDGWFARARVRSGLRPLMGFRGGGGLPGRKENEIGINFGD